MARGPGGEGLDGVEVGLLVLPVDAQAGEADLAVAAGAGAAEAVELDELEALQHGVEEALVVAGEAAQAEAEVEAGAGGHALGVAGVLGDAGDAVDAVLALDLGEHLVVVAHGLLPGGAEAAVPEGEAGGAELGGEGGGVLELAAADAEELQDALDLVADGAAGGVEGGLVEGASWTAPLRHSSRLRILPLRLEPGM
jgi:hypothetical protein